MPTRNPLDWIALNLLPDVGPILARRALARFHDPGRIAYRLTRRELESIRGFGGSVTDGILEARRKLVRAAEREQRRADELGLCLLTPDHPDYPADLAELPDAPMLLYLRGKLPGGVPRIAIVGSRRATEYGKRVATGMAAELVVRGIEVVSGGARGIDTAAHRGALEENGRTVAVLGSGFAQPYPPENVALFDRIASSGAVLSEFPLDVGPVAGNFPRRNRLISGLASAVVVVEADRRSGSLITAGHALEQGREVLAVPGPIDSGRSLGCHFLIQQGAKLVQNFEDILEELSPMYRGAVPERPTAKSEVPIPGLLPDEQAVLALFDGPEPVQVDTLADRAPFGFARVQAALFGLEVHGAIVSHPGGYYGLPARRLRSP